MSENIENLAIKYGAGILHIKEIIAYVNNQLDKGIWNDIYLEILDSDAKSWPTIFELFEGYIKSKGLTIPTIEEAVRDLVEQHIEKIASGEVVPSEQFGKLLRDIDNYDYYSKTQDYVGDNLGIHQMYGWYYEDYCNLDQINKGIFEESKKWLVKYANTNK